MSRKIILDIGNTRFKLALLNGQPAPENPMEGPLAELEPVLKKLDIRDRDILALSNVAALPPALDQWLGTLPGLIRADAYTPTGLQMGYESPATLGSDRYMAATGAYYDLAKPADTLVVDFGTCIKYDFVTRSGVYSGGAISPGWDMRFKAMHTFTGKLPLLEIEPGEETPSFIGKNTRQSMHNGVLEGIRGELDHMIQKYRENYSDLSVFFTGGYAGVFVNKTENNIFVRPNLVLAGLAHVIRYNQK